MSNQTPDVHLGTVIDDRYRIDELIARGGMATVYRALDLRLGRVVAVKILAPAFTADPDFVSRFTQEARATAALTHPNVVAVHDQGVSNGFPYLVMEFVPGRTIRQVLMTMGPFTSAHALEIMRAVLAGLGAAHDAGFVHRDIKPENVLITDTGVIKVTDFGLARVIDDIPVSDSTGAVLLGTMAYLSPEQVQQKTIDQRSDVYSAGILLFEMLTGHVPYVGESPLDVAYKHVNNDVPAPSTEQHDIPPAVDHLVLAATRRSPNDRFQNAHVFLDAVNRASQAVPAAEALTTVLPTRQTLVMAHPGISTPPAHTSLNSTPQSSKKPVSPKVKRRRIIAGVLTLTLIIGSVSWFFFAGSKVPVPVVAGKSLSDATNALQAVGLRATVAQTFSETVPNGSVVDSNPVAGQSAKEGSTVTLNVSKGQERYLIPMDLKNKDINDATSQLQDLTLVVVNPAKQIYDDKVPVGKVVGTKPTGGTKVKRGASVILLVSQGPKPILVPPIAGENITSATAQLTKLGLVVDVTDQVFDTSAVGTVISANPVPGTTVKKGDTISVTVSKGPPPIQVPNVVGLDITVAKTILIKAGFKVSVQNQLSTVVLNKVYSQNPGADSMATPGSTITLKIV